MSSSDSDDSYVSDSNSMASPQATIVSAGAPVLVGVIDTGIDASHPALAGKIHQGNLHSKFRLIGGNVVRTPVVVPEDYNGHGTHVAGIIASVFPSVKLVSLNIAINDEGSGFSYTKVVAEAIKFAEDNDIKILNFSGSDSYNGDIYNALAGYYTGLFVNSAGNNGYNISYNSDNVSHILPRVYPSCHRLDNMIVVGAANSDGTKWSSSNYGSNQYPNNERDTVHLFAPGVDILSTYPMARCDENMCNQGNLPRPGSHHNHAANGYHYMSGTSMAAPVVAA
jgi:major intracellular serine protease